ncbi:MAG: hypothetical protein AAGD32_11370 [Planctomycetota bacterium]
MKSHEVIRDAVKEPGVKQVASALRVSQALVYKWCEEKDDGEIEGSGARNPLDRVAELYGQTKDIRLIRYLCNRAGGFFVANPDLDIRKSRDEAIFDETRSMFGEFSELLDAIHRSTANDPYIDANEAEIIRDKWEDLKAVLERFVTKCEEGHYHVLPEEKQKLGKK